MQHDDLSTLPVAVLGAGPVGLAAAAHLIERGLEPLILEAGEGVGASFASYRHVRLFSPWRYNVDKAARRLLAGHGWQAPNNEALPTAGELLDAYLAPLAALPGIASRLHLCNRVTAISRAGIDKVKTRGREDAPFLIRTSTAAGPREYLARAVIDATGTWHTPNPLGANGLPALGEASLRERIAYGMPDVLGAGRARYAGKRVLVAGAGHSAAGTLLALADLAHEAAGTRLVWVTRGGNLARVFGGGEADGLPARGQLGMRLKSLRDSGQLEMRQGFAIHALEAKDGRIAVHGLDAVIEGVDEIVCATGARPDLSITRELRVRHDPWLESTDALAPLIDPNEHSCGTVRPHGHRELAHPEPGYYAVGAKSYGRAPNFLLATGYEQARSVAAAIAGDLPQADDVQLDLPQTGVCSTRRVYEAAVPKAAPCCANPPADPACCAEPLPDGRCCEKASAQTACCA